MTLRVAFLGNDPWSVPSLDAIAAEPELSLALVVTNPPKEAGRGAALTPTAVAKAATAHAAPMLEVGGVLDGPGATALAEAAPDVLVVVAYGQHPASRDAQPRAVRRDQPPLLPVAPVAGSDARPACDRGGR